MDVFVLAVPAGSMSISLLEAMARGLPPIITFGGPEEAVIHAVTGLCPPPINPPALAEAIARLIDDVPLRRQLGAAAAEHVRRHFSVQRVADDLLEVYANAPRGILPRRLRAWLPPESAQSIPPPALATPTTSHEL
jgi:glycosyltransferase involved in cell wall biosynthesis